MTDRRRKGKVTMNRYVITIARGYGSGGRTIGQMLAADLGINCYDKEILKFASDDSGINEETFAKSDEKLKRTTLYRVAKNVYKGEGMAGYGSYISEESLFNYQAKVLRELALRESYVVIGRCADYILSDLPNVVKVFVHAPLEQCIDVVADKSPMTRSEIEQFILKTDAYRAQYYFHHTGRAWNDARNYDICLNTKGLSFEKSVEVLKNYINLYIL